MNWQFPPQNSSITIYNPSACVWLDFILIFVFLKTTTQFIQLILEKVCLAAVYDDNSSKSKEDALVITKFDGCAVGTKGGGIQKMVRKC